MSSYLDNLYDELRKPLPSNLPELLRKSEEWRQRLYDGEPNSIDWNLKSQYIKDLDRAIELAQAASSRNEVSVEMSVPVVDRTLVTELLGAGERSTLDWKRDFPAGLVAGKKDLKWDSDRGVLLKDLVAVADSVSDAPGFLVYGVADQSGTRTVVGDSGSYDDADFQIWAENTFDSPIRFSYVEISWDEGKRVAVFAVVPSATFPHVVARDLGGILHVGQIWFRRGSKNTVALRQDMERMFGPQEPDVLFFERTNDVELESILQSIRDSGREPVLARYESKDAKILSDYEVAHHPVTRQEIVVGRDTHGQYELVAMLQPVSQDTN